MDHDATTAIDAILGHSLMSSAENSDLLKAVPLSEQYDAGNLLVNDMSGKTEDTSGTKPFSLEESEQQELVNRARMGLLSKNQRYMLQKQALRQNPKYKQEEQVRSRERMQAKRNDPGYREAERLRDRERRRRARENNRDQRERERERDRLYKQRIRQTGLQVVREEIVPNTEVVPLTSTSEDDTLTNTDTQIYVQTRGTTSNETTGTNCLNNESQPLLTTSCDYQPGGVVVLQEGPQSFIVCTQTSLPVLEM